jgi:hypothetical protein
VDDIQGSSQDGTPIKGRSGKVYYVRPCGLDTIPKLLEQVNIVDKTLTSGEDINKYLASSDSPLLNAMGKIIAIGMDIDINDSEKLKTVMQEFSLGKFPIVYKIVLDLNDFLAGMRTLYQQ